MQTDDAYEQYYEYQDYYDYYDTNDNETQVKSDTSSESDTESVQSEDSEQQSESSDSSSSSEEDEENEEQEDNEQQNNYDYNGNYYDYDYPWYDEESESEQQNDESSETNTDSNTEESSEESNEESEDERPTRNKKNNHNNNYTRTSQCPFQEAPNSPSSYYESAFIADATSYLDAEVSAVRSGTASSETRDETMRCIYHYAEHYECVSGNWLAFVQRDYADDVWERVREANESGKFAGYVEMRASRGNDVAIAAYVPDYRDARTVGRVINSLQRLGVRVTTFKPSLLTTLGVYRDQHEHTRYTYAELGFSTSPVPPEVRNFIPRYYAAATAKRNGRRKRNQRRGGGGGGGHQHHAVYYYRNNYYHGRRHSPSLPNGTWKPEEEGQFILHVGRPAYVTGRGGYGEGYGHAIARGYLDAHRERIQSGEYVSATEKRELMGKLWELADSYNVVVGKWTVFVKASVADQVWKEICSLNDAGQLGGSIKCSPFNERSGGFAIFVYCNDFTNTDDCSRILHLLANTCSRYGVGMIANFKPDFFTQLGIYRSNLKGYPVNYPLNELGLAKHWPHPTLKYILDRVKHG